MKDSDLTRREFLEISFGVMAGAAAFGSQEARGETVLPGTGGASEQALTLRINGTDHQLRIDPRTTLLDCIRETVALTGTKKGCRGGGRGVWREAARRPDDRDRPDERLQPDGDQLPCDAHGARRRRRQGACTS